MTGSIRMTLAVQHKQVTDGGTSSTNQGLRICFISSFPPNYARLSEYSHSLITELQKHPKISHIHVIANSTSGLKEVEVNEKLSVSYVWQPDNVLSILSLFFRIMRAKPNVVHFNIAMAFWGRSRLANFVGLLLPFFCGLARFRTVVTLHNVYEMVDIEKTGYRNTSLNRIGSYVALKLLTSCSIVTLLVRSYVKLVREKYRSKNVHWLPHGTWNVRPLKYPVDENPKIILYMGHSGPSKDLDLLLKSFSVISQERDAVKLLIAGRSHPNYPRFLENYVKEKIPNVEFLGYVDNVQLRSFFGRSHILVLPYHTCTGTSGMAHLAASYGVPMVATDLLEFRELVEDGCGIVLCSHNPQSLIEKIYFVIDNLKVAEDLRRRSLAFTRTRRWKNVADELYRYYTS